VQRAIAAIVLAGGRGRRYGFPKATAKLPDGRTFLTACVTTLRRAGARVVVATLPPGFDGPVPRRVVPIEISFRESDQFASLRRGAAAALAAGPWDVLVVHPVDHPLVRPSTVRRLVAVESQTVAPSHAGRGGHPVVLGRGIVNALVDGSEPGPTLREVLARAGVATVEVDDPGVVTNCNTPAALAAAFSRQAGT
jgi:CTP:molybdopterin cytidylyltransferase MocA